MTTPNRLMELIASVLASEIECGVFEQHVAPALEVARKALAGKPTPGRTGVGEYCQPGDRREPRWIVMYDDADRSHSVFEDEQDARDCFANSETMGWNCWLFSPTRREMPMDAIIALASQAQCPVTLDDERATKAPFSNCRFKMCDLPGQCVGEGKCHHPAVPAAQPTPDDHHHHFPLAWRDTFDGLLAYVLQDDLHNRLTPRIIDIAYTAFMSRATGKNNDDGGPCDWFNDTKPVVQAAIAKLSKDLSEARAVSDGNQAIVSLLERARYVRHEDLPPEVRKEAEIRASYGNGSARQDAVYSEQSRLIDEAIALIKQK